MIMFKSFLRAMSVAMLIVGTMIGAGFASGREIVVFFGNSPNVVVAVITAVLIFLLSTLFLFVGRRVNKNDVGEVNGLVFGKLRVVADIFILFNSMTVLGAMLAGTDSLFAEVVDIRPVASIVVGVICAVIAVSGMKGVIKSNAVLVPIMVAFLLVISLRATKFPIERCSDNLNVLSTVLYVSMNMILGGGVLSTVHNLSPREIILSSAIASIIVGGVLTFIMSAISSSSAVDTDMPMLLIALKSGRVSYFISLPIIGVSIFTTMLSAFKSVYDYVCGFIKNKFIATCGVLIVGLGVGALGFSNVVGSLYPLMGALGIVYIACNGWFLIRHRVVRYFKNRIKKRKTKKQLIR